MKASLSPGHDQETMFLSSPPSKIEKGKNLKGWLINHKKLIDKGNVEIAFVLSSVQQGAIL